MQEPELCLGHCQTSKTAKNCQLLTQKISITDRCLTGSRYASEGIFPDSIYLDDHFEFRISHFSKTYVCEYPGVYLTPYQNL